MKRLFQFAAWSFVLLVMVVVGCTVTIYAGTVPYIYTNVSALPQAHVALVPGAAILANGTLSSIFTDRVDLAIALYKANKVSKILVSGDNSTVSHNEVNPARLYLIREGVPEEDIFLDHAGFDTYSSMYRARDIFGASSVLITTQAFHMPRAVFIARALGLEAYGVHGEVEHVLFRNYIREVFANEKAILDLIRQRTPKYLGEEIVIPRDES